jgi:sulfatase modifying factor 1
MTQSAPESVRLSSASVSTRGKHETRAAVAFPGGLLAAAAGIALIQLTALPAPGAARSRVAVDTWPDMPPQERALTGGLVRLRAPASTMIRVAASTFQMGSTPTEVIEAMADCNRQRSSLGHRPTQTREWPSCAEDFFSVELPRHRVTVSSYWLDRTEVTVAAYQRCVQLRRCKPAAYRQGGSRFAKPHYPVSLVSFSQAADYCKFRGARLPTEAEFERAARGLARRKYPWGNLYNSRACNHGRLGWMRTNDGDGFAELAPVGSFPSGRTPDGFLDLAGNVAEWVGDFFAVRYPNHPVVDPTGPTGRGPGAIVARVIRGGHYKSAAPFVRGAARSNAEPSTIRPSVGFRCARPAAPR